MLIVLEMAARSSDDVGFATIKPVFLSPRRLPIPKYSQSEIG